jgi:hypothetical protein
LVRLVRRSRCITVSANEAREPPLLVPKTQSAFHPRAQRNAFRRRDAHCRPSYDHCSWQPGSLKLPMRVCQPAALDCWPANV